MIDLQKLWDMHAVWSEKTFGIHAGTSTLTHLAREVEELRAAPDDLEEYADCLILLMDAARRQGYSLDDLLLATASKFVANTCRVWGEPDDEGVVEHVEVQTWQPWEPITKGIPSAWKDSVEEAFNAYEPLRCSCGRGYRIESIGCCEKCLDEIDQR